MAKETPISLTHVLNTKDLCRCVNDVLDWQKSGVLDHGSLRILAERIQDYLGCDESDALQHAEAAVLREAAIRYMPQNSCQFPPGWAA